MGDLAWTDLRREPAGPVVWVGLHATSRPVTVPSHALEAWQVCAAVSGGLALRIDGAAVSVPGGSWIVVPPGTRLSSAGVVRGRIAWIGLDPTKASGLDAIHRRRLTADLRRLAMGANRGSEAVHAAASLVATAAPGWERLAAGLAVVAALTPALTQASLPDPGIAPALEALHAQPAHPWTVVALAGLCGLAAARFHARFRAATGSTPHEAMVAARLDLARMRLAAGATVAQAAADCGFASLRGFERAYRRVHGSSPTGR